MKAVICPVCNGKGRLPPQEDFSTYYENMCHGCEGKGWVEIGNADDRLKPIENITFTLPPDYNKCPSCGGDRNSPALTGCPKGSHYGSYCSV